MPDIALSTDMIVGFPGETAEDFEETLSLTAAVRYHSMFSFKYSPRPNTLALKRLPDDVTEEEKTRRIVALQALQREIQGELLRRGGRPDVDGAGRLAQPPARLGAVGPDERQHGRELRRDGRSGSAGSSRCGSRARTRTASAARRDGCLTRSDAGPYV